MKSIGITGGIGSGKSQILGYLKERYGASVCQADEVGKILQKKGTECFRDIIRHFGREVLASDGELDRGRLGEIVFSDKKELAILNGIVHPAVKEEIIHRKNRELDCGTKLFVLEAALLLEDHYEEMCDEMWYLHVEDSIRRERLIHMRGYSEKAVDEIMAVQLSNEEFLRRCDRVIENGGTFEQTQMQVDQIMAKLRQSDTDRARDMSRTESTGVDT